MKISQSLFLLCLCTFTTSVFATRVIVELKPGATLQSYSSVYKADSRMTTNRKKWSYINPSVLGAMQSLEKAYFFKSNHAYSKALNGFSANLTDAQINALKMNPLVASVTKSIKMYASGQTLPWGIDRVDADMSFTKAGDGSGSVNNVNLYVIDTGVDGTHPDLNVVESINFTVDGKNYDCHGHGTHVAGTIAAKDDGNGVVGVAPGAPITALKVLDCNGSGWSDDIIKAIDWITSNRKLPAVANMSLGGGINNLVDNAVLRSAISGSVFYALAAGNSAVDACNTSPARSGKGDNGIMTTAATDSSSQEVYFSNYGVCSDIWAPGVSVYSTYPVIKGGFKTMNGTSMASPHVAGSAALYLSMYPSATPLQVEQYLKSKAVVTGTASKDNALIKVVNVSSLKPLNLSFLPKANYSGGSHSSYIDNGIITGDFNNDGKPDLAAVDSYSNTVSILLRNASNTGFDAEINYPVGSTPTSISAGDFNNDGKLDLAVANSNSNTVSILFRNQANTGFETKVDYAVGNAPVSIIKADFNGDGKLDLMTVNNADNSLSVLFRNQTNTGFETKVDYATGISVRAGWFDPLKVSAGDLNNDGKADLVVNTHSTNFISVLLRNAANTGFDAKVDYAVGSSPYYAGVGDFNNDGKLDLAVPNFFSNTVSILLRNSTNTGFNTKVDYPTGAAPVSVKVADFNGDGKLDLAVFNAYSFSVSILLQNSTNTGFNAKVDYSTNAYPRGMTVGDFNNDGSADFAVVHDYSAPVAVWLNDSK